MVTRMAYVTTYNVLDRSTWPKTQVGLCGAGYHLALSLENQSVQLDYIGDLEEKSPSLTNKFKWHFYHKLFKKDYFYFVEPLVLREYASQISRGLSNFNSHVVLCPENAIPIAYLDCKQPIVFWTDAPIAASINFYPWLSRLCNETKRNIYELEKSALDRCELVIFSSDWAAQTAVHTYGIEPSKIRVVPWGANIECDLTNEKVNNIVESRSTALCKLLFVGVEWFRKGGDTALEVAKELNKIGVNSELLVVGCQPNTSVPIPSFVKSIGFIDKYTNEGLAQMKKLFAESHFLIVPSRAEIYGHVFCEANSFGLPCLATKVGGITTIIKDDINGKTFSINASISEYCNYIAALMADYKKYKQLAASSFQEYQSRLNWSVAGKKVKEILMEMV